MHYAETPLNEFFDTVASATIAPAGGTVIAFVGAAGAALCEMACIHTARYRSTESDCNSKDPDGSTAVEDGKTIVTVRQHLHQRRSDLLRLGDADARIVDSAFGSSEAVNEQTDNSAERLRRWLKPAVGVPLTIAEVCCAIIELGVETLRKSIGWVRTDAWVGISLVRSAFDAAVQTALDTLDRCDDPVFTERIKHRLATTKADVDSIVSTNMRRDDLESR